MDSPKLNELPMPAKVAGGVAVLGTFAGLAYLIRDLQYIAILSAGLVLVGLIVGLFLFLRHRREVAKGDAMARKLPSGTPGGVRKADQIAQMDAMRRAFEEGVARFREAGRSLYSTPWYLLVGESGGGKTEAIRHSQVRFFPGLQDFLQGTGGTINMNWWFTRDAVILDTAGRIFIPEMQAGSGGEWDQFLNLLKGYRPHCPINGLLLMIPANTLLSDTSQQIDQKASRIAQQFERVQMTLGVRFPVYVVITKCDLLGGFNEFFEDLADPRQQNQMMGWSNPAPLDLEFDPKLVDEHLQVVRNRLMRRRTRLLLEPPPTEGGASRRLDQVDSLYNLPDNLMRIAPRLRQYLETIFVAGAWSQRPLFLRGIYFTCAMQKGSPLDPDLAMALGIPVTDLPKDREWDRTRSYFLRDVFMEKAFAEKGLVTRVTNVDAHRRRRKIAVLGGGFLAAAAFLVFTYLGYNDLQKNILSHANFFAETSAGKSGGYDPNTTIVVDPAGRYTGNSLVEVDRVMKVTDLLAESKTLANRDIRPWLIYKQFAPRTRELNESRREAHGALVVAAVLTPVIEATRKKLEAGGPWTEDASKALVQLIRLERQVSEARAARDAASNKSAPASTRPLAQGYQWEGWDALFRFAMPQDEYVNKFVPVRKQILEDIVGWTYKPRESGGAGDTWPPEYFVNRPDYLKVVIGRGVDQFVKYCDSQGATNEKQYAAVIQLEDALKQFQQAEQKLYAVAGEEPASIDRYTQALQDWRAGADEVYARGKNVDACIKTAADALQWDQAAPLARVYEEKVKASQEGTRRAIEQLMAEVKGDTPVLVDARQKLQAAVTAIDQRQMKAMTPEHMAELSRLNDLFLQRPGEAQTKSLADLAGLFPSLTGNAAAAHRYQVQLNLFKSLGECFQQAVDPWKQGVAPDGKPRSEEASIFGLAARLRDSEARYQKLKDTFADVLAKDAVKDEPLAKAIEFARRGLAQQFETFTLLRSAMQALPPTREDWETSVQAYAQANGLIIKRSPIPLTDPRNEVLDGRYAPGAIRRLADGWKSLVAQTADVPPPGARVLPCLSRDTLRADLPGRQDVLMQYISAYCQYWRDSGPRTTLAFLVPPVSPDVADPKGWPDFRSSLEQVRIANIQAGLRAFGGTLQDAFSAGAELEAVIPALRESARASGCAAGVAEVRSAIDEIDKSDKTWGQVVRNWLSLSADPLRARDQLLPMKLFDFANGYTLKSSSFLDAYWQQLPLVGLDLLAKHVDRQAQADIASLRVLQKFPLTPPAQDGSELNLGQIVRARELVRQIDSGTDLDKDSLGANPPQEFKAKVEMMSGRTVWRNDAEIKWFKQVRKLLDALPQKDGQVTCKVTVLAFETHINSPDLRIMQGAEAEAMSVRTDSVFSKPLSLWSTNDLRFEVGVFDRGVGPARASYPADASRIPAKWALLRAMYDLKATPVTVLPNVAGKAAHAWKLKVPIDENGSKGEVALLLQFDTRDAGKPDAEMLQASDWPTLQAQK